MVGGGNEFGTSTAVNRLRKGAKPPEAGAALGPGSVFILSVVASVFDVLTCGQQIFFLFI